MSLPILVASTLGGLMITGISWYVIETMKAAAPEKDALRDAILIQDIKPLSEDDLVDIGTGPQAEEKLGDEIRNTRSMILVAGYVGITVSSLIRNFCPPGIALQILINPEYAKATQVARLKRSYGANVMISEEITSDESTVIFIDGKKTLILRTANNGLMMAKDEDAAIALARKSTQMWYAATKVFE